MNIFDAIKNKNLIRTYGELADLKSPESYYEFKAEEEAESWGRKFYSSWADAHKAIYACSRQYREDSVLHASDPVDMYLGNEYRDINSYLRSGETDEISIPLLTRISNLIIAVSSAPVIDRKLILYRQVP